MGRTHPPILRDHVADATPTIFFNLVMSIIGSFQVFYPIVPDDQRRTKQRHVVSYVLYLFRKAFQHFEMGYASAAGLVLFAIIMFFTLSRAEIERAVGLLEGERR